MSFKIFSGTANRPLAEQISKAPDIEQELGSVEITCFADGEQYVRFEENLRGQTIFIVQPTNQPDSNLIQLFLLLKAAHGASAQRIVAVIPYYGYARQERKTAGREAISASLWAQFIDSLNIEKVLFTDLHAGAIEGFFRNTKVDHIYARPVFIPRIREIFADEIGSGKLVVVSPDSGGVDRARAYAKRLNNSDLAIIDKRREAANTAEAVNVIGEVEDKTALIVDDMFDTCGTVVDGSRALMERGARQIFAVATHGLFSGNALEKIKNSPIEKLFVSDTIHRPCTEQGQNAKIETISMAHQIAKAVVRIADNKSLSSALFD